MTRKCDTTKYRRRRVKDLDNRRRNKRVGICPLCRCPIRQSDIPDNIHSISVGHGLQMTAQQVHRTCPTEHGS